MTQEILKQFNSKNLNERYIDENLSKMNLSKKELIDNSFDSLSELVSVLSSGKKTGLLEDIRKISVLISFLINNEKLCEDDIKKYKKKIKEIRENILIKAKKYNCKSLYETANILDEIALSKYMDENDLIIIIKKLIDSNENINVIKKYININKKVITNSNELFDYVFELTCASIKENKRNVFYYISLLKIFYNSKINVDYYQNKLNNLKKECGKNSSIYFIEITDIINGYKRPFDHNKILQKYDINTKLKDENIYIPKSVNTSKEKMFTIDSIGTRARDDGLSIVKDGNKYIVGIHIADVGKAIIPDSFLDTQAKENLKCEYIQKGIRILTENCENSLSLNKKNKRNTITLYVVLNDSGDMLDYYIKENNVIVSENLDFLQADRIMSGINYNEFGKDLNELFYLAQALHSKSKHKIDYWQKKDNSKSDNNTKGMYKSEKIINEFMVLYNSVLGKIAKENDFPYIYRYQDKEYITDLMNNLGIEINDDIKKIIDSTYLDSKYSPVPRWHDGMGIDYYTQSVAPLRKYPDLYDQYLLHIFYFNDLDYHFDENRFENLVEYFNQRSQELVLMRSEYSREMRLERKFR